MIRNKCVICAHDKLTTVAEFKNFPVFMGTVSRPDVDFRYNDLILVECTRCKTTQVLDLVPLALLYQTNHNVDIVGDTWKRHNAAFARFVAEVNPRNVLEVGDPSFKIASLLIDVIESWCVVEPNISDNVLQSGKIRYIRKWFEDVGLDDFENIDCVVLSHVFEHLYSPRDFLNKCSSIADTIIISVPNMDCMLESGALPSINFEHTFFLNDQNLKIMLQDCGYYIESCEFFENHSVFYKIKKTYNAGNVIVNIITSYYAEVARINNLSSSYDYVYLYGANFPAQMLIALGLDDTRIVGILDNSKSKIGNYLYGTKHMVFHPTEIAGKDNCLVICKMGVYDKEIKNNLLNINDKVVVI